MFDSDPLYTVERDACKIQQLAYVWQFNHGLLLDSNSVLGFVKERLLRNMRMCDAREKINLHRSGWSCCSQHRRPSGCQTCCSDGILDNE